MPSWKRRNPLVTKHDPPPELPAPPTEVELALEQARKDRRTVGKILSRDGTFVIDPDLELMTVGAATDPSTGVGIFLGLDSPDYEFRVGDPAGDQMLWDGSALTITGSVTATTGTIGGWTIGATTLSSGNVTLDSAQESLRLGAATDANTGTGIYIGLDSAVYEFRAGNPSGNRIHWDGSNLIINGATITQPLSNSVLQIAGWYNYIDFSIDDYNTVSWSGGSLVFPIGLAPTINAGTTNNMAAATTYYIYYDRDIALNDLQVTSIPALVSGFNKVLVAVAKPNADTTKLAELIVFGGGKDPYSSTLITADHVVANTITANEIAANTITASEIAAGTITANEITGTTLSAIYADMGTLTAGQITAGSISISADNEQILFGNATAPTVGNPGIFLGKDGADYELRIGHYTNGNYVWWDGTNLWVRGAVITEPASGSDVGLLGWSQSLTWSVTDYNTVAWSAGSIFFADGQTLSIDAGNTGDMSSPTFVYLDRNASLSVLQTTTVASSAAGSEKVLIAVCAPNADTAKNAEFQVFGSASTVAGSKIITADVIAAETITANEIATNTITANRLDVGTLSAISADMGSLTAGSIVIGTTNKIWLNDSADGALNIGGSTKGSAPFRVTAAGALTATSATITGTITSTSTIAADSFTGANPIFDNSLVIEGGDAADRVTLNSSSSSGQIELSTGSSGSETVVNRLGYSSSIHADVGLGTTAAAQVGLSGGNLNFTASQLYVSGALFGTVDSDFSTRTTSGTSRNELDSVAMRGQTLVGFIAEYTGSTNGTNGNKNIYVGINGTDKLTLSLASGGTGDFYIRVWYKRTGTSSGVGKIFYWHDALTPYHKYAQFTDSINTNSTTNIDVELDATAFTAGDTIDLDMSIVQCFYQ